MAAINNDWAEALKEEYKKPYYRELYKKVNEEYQTHEIFPPSDEIFSAFHLTPLKDVKVVILGQDPYHNNGQAHGLSFSVKPGVDIPPSLVNIYKELHDDLGCYIPNNGYLVKWAEQGVLLLNTVLTVRAHQANSHREESDGKSLRMQRYVYLMHRIGQLYFCFGEGRHRIKSRCLRIQII